MSALIDNAITPARRQVLLTSDCRDRSAQPRESKGDERLAVRLLARNEAAWST